jgi:hypothetical protein
MPDNEKDIDYLHPNGKTERRPRGEQEKKNEQKAEESTELAEELKQTVKKSRIRVDH